MKILWAKSGGLLPLDAGGKIRSYNIACELARRHEVTLFTFYPALSPDPHDQLWEPFSQVERLHINVPARAGLLDTLAYAVNALTTRPYQARKFCRPEARKRLQELVTHKHYDAIVCDFLLTADVAPWASGIPTVIFAHNVEAALWRRRLMFVRNPLWKLVAWREHRMIARFERHFMGLADHVLAVSESDRKLLLEFLPPSKVTTVPTGVDLSYFRPACAPESRSLVFTGSMDWQPNEDAIVYFSNEILPLIQKEVPAVTLSVVGKNPTAKLRALGNRNRAIRISGAVDDIRPYVQSASVYIVPLRIGGGTRIKIFEAMAMGKAVVSTSIGAEGLPVKNGRDIIIADTAATFAESIIHLLRTPADRDGIGRSGRSLVESGHSWIAAANIMEREIERVSARSRLAQD